MPQARMDHLKRVTRFDEWAGRNTLDGSLFVSGYSLSGSEVPGWRVQLNQEVAPPVAPPGPSPLESMAAESSEAASPEAAGPQPWLRFVQSVWSAPLDHPQAALSIDVYECASRLAAHETLVRLLGEFQLPVAQSQTRVDLGDMAFAEPGDTGILFARGNLVLHIANIGRELVPVAEIARLFDMEIASQPEEARIGTVAPEALTEVVAAATAPRFARAAEALESMEAVDEAPPSRPAMKLFARHGEISAEGGQLSYQPTAPGPHEVEVYALTPGREPSLPQREDAEPVDSTA